ncbi:MAG: glycosyltransferase family 2 protein [Pseudanabaenaceae cyanobacterium]|jgi:glycosyltransferase involved in cell wall biosynthesis
MIEQIQPLILTYNEAPNIARTLAKLSWAKRIVVIDSFSTDETLEILAQCPQVVVYQRKFDDFANQCNYGLTQITAPWVLSIDADYVLSDALITELHSLAEQGLLTDSNLTDSSAKSGVKYDGYWVDLRYCVMGQQLRSTILPPRQVLYRRSQGQYFQDGHAHRLHLDGTAGRLRGCINHDDRKDLARWLWAQQRYTKIEAEKLLTTPFNQLKLVDRLRTYKVITPLLIFFYCLVWKGGVWDGWSGWYYAWQRMLAEILTALYLIELEWQRVGD